MEYMRIKGGSTDMQLEFADFSVGFPENMELDQIYISYIAAKHGPEAISMDTYAEEFTS